MPTDRLPNLQNCSQENLQVLVICRWKRLALSTIYTSRVNIPKIRFLTLPLIYFLLNIALCLSTITLYVCESEHLGEDADVCSSLNVLSLCEISSQYFPILITEEWS